MTAIQAHGVLLALDADLTVTVVSVNVAQQLGTEVEEVLGRPFAALVGTDVSARVAAARDPGDTAPGEPMVAVLGKPGSGILGGEPTEVRVKVVGDLTLVELEPAVVDGTAGGDYPSLRASMTRLAAASTLAALADLIASEMRELTGFDRVMVQRHETTALRGAARTSETRVIAEARREGLEPVLGHAVPTTATAPGARRREPLLVVADVEASPAGLVAVGGEHVVEALDLSRTALRDLPDDERERLRVAGVTATMVLPIAVDDHEWGVIACHHYSGPRRPGHEVRSSAEFFTQVASHLVAHRARADAREAAARTRAEMAEMATRLTATEGPVLDAVFADPGLLTVFGAVGAANLFEGELRTAGTVPDLDTMQQVSDLLNLPDSYTSSTDRLAALDADFATHADVAEGVLRVGTLADRWGLWFRTDGAPWEPWHIEAADDLGRHVNSLLLLRSREQVAMAESVQRSVVLDRAPELAGVELVARYRPATTYQLGGDWWDAFELDEHRLVLVVGDVAGHGVAAASAMTQVRTALRAYLYDGHGPAAALDRLDRLMDGLLGVGTATALVAVLDRATGQIELASAGHPDPVLVAPDGTAREVELARRPLLGVGVGQAPVSYLDLADGSLLVLFTDGLVERRDSDIQVQVDRLVDLAAGGLDLRPHDGLAQWADQMLAELDTPDDDTTVLAVRCT